MRLLHEIAIFQTVKSKVIISLFETVKLSVSISLRNLYNSLNSIKENLKILIMITTRKADARLVQLRIYYVTWIFCHVPWNSGARFTKLLEPKIFLSAIQFLWDLRKS